MGEIYSETIMTRVESVMRERAHLLLERGGELFEVVQRGEEGDVGCSLYCCIECGE